MLKQFSNFIADGLHLTLGDTLHAGHIPPQSPAACSAVLERTPAYAYPYTPETREFHFQIYTRAVTYFAARDEANRIFNFLVEEKRGGQLTNWYMASITGQGPAYIGQDGLGRYEFSSNVSVVARKKKEV